MGTIWSLLFFNHLIFCEARESHLRSARLLPAGGVGALRKKQKQNLTADCTHKRRFPPIYCIAILAETAAGARRHEL